MEKKRLKYQQAEKYKFSLLRKHKHKLSKSINLNTDKELEFLCVNCYISEIKPFEEFNENNDSDNYIMNQYEIYTFSMDKGENIEFIGSVFLDRITIHPKFFNKGQLYRYIVNEYVNLIKSDKIEGEIESLPLPIEDFDNEQLMINYYPLSYSYDDFEESLHNFLKTI